MTQDRPLLGGRYQLDEVIGRGGMAEVWRARDIRLGRDVAVKRLRVDLATDPTFQARFRREAQAAAGLNHPNIVSTYDTGEEIDDRTTIAVPWIVMELVEGDTLRELLQTHTALPPEQAFELSRGVLDALGHSHRAGIVHRDIKPANVMLTPSGQVKVMDFGIARAVADTSATMTQTAAVIGTAQYLSPEQARGETVDARSDIYSAGCLLYELLVGRPPFIGDSPVSVAYQHVREAPAPPSQLDPQLTPSMDAIVLKSLAKDPDERYQSAREMRDDIARLLAGQQVTAPLPAPVPPVGPPTAATAVVPESAASGSTAVSPPSAVAVDDETAGLTAVEDEQPRRRSLVGWVLVILGLALAALIGFTLWAWLTPNDDPEMAAVPVVVGQNEQAATADLKAAGFGVTSQHVNGDAATENQVTDQDPPGGKEARRGSTVTITINDGPKTVTVPDLVGLSRDQARQRLVDAGFASSGITFADATAEAEADHPDLDKGEVVTSNPASGAEVVLSAKQGIKVYLATGKVRVPKVVDQAQDEARSALETLGLEVAVNERETTEPGKDGRVLEQNPAGGKRVERGSTVQLIVGRYRDPEPTQTPSATASASPTAQETSESLPVPNVTDQALAVATKTLQDAGFTVAVSGSTVNDPNLEGKVVDQSPAGGQAERGSTVTIGVGRYEPTQTAEPSPTQTP
ncbi:Stk1 family PASTA domain-containing Ser/Thr kinase [Luteococcus sediminum]